MNSPVLIVATLFTGATLHADTKAAQPPLTPTSLTTSRAEPWTAAAAQARCRAAAEYSDSKDGHALLVMHRGNVVFEHYQGWSADRPHPLASGTKSFSGIAAALAVQDGLLTLDEPVAQTITEWASDPVKSTITVRQLLSLSAGLAPMDSELQGARSTDRGAAALTAPQSAPPGERFIYGPSSFYVFGELIERKLAAADSEHSNIEDYLEARIFRPLGISPRFGRDVHGNPNLPGGCMVNARDWAIFGELIRNQGRHDGRQLVNQERLSELLTPHGPNPRYGLTWWLLREGDGQPEADLTDGGSGGRPARERRSARNRQPPDEPAEQEAQPGRVLGVMAAGLGKQRLYILPEHELTIVRFGHLRGGTRPPLDDGELLRLPIPDSAQGNDPGRNPVSEPSPR